MITLDQIAREAGVSPATVANVLKGRNKEVRPSAVRRAEEIRSIAERLGYQVNGTAKATSTGRFGCVAILLAMDENASALPPQVWRGLHDEPALNNIHITMFHMPDEELTETNRLPAVWFNTWRKHDCVRPDDTAASRFLGKHLLELGHRRIAYLDFSHVTCDIERGGEMARDHYSADDRYHGVREVLAAAKVKMPSMVERRAAFEARVEGVKEILKRTHRPLLSPQAGDAFDSTLLAARDLKLDVPRDLSVVSFGPPNMGFLGLRATVMAVPEREIGQELARMILQKIEQPEKKIAARILPLRFIEGDTCAPAHKAA